MKMKALIVALFIAALFTPALSNSVGGLLIYTQAQKDADAAFVKLNAATLADKAAWNATILADEAALKASKKALDDYDMSPTELAQEKVKDLEKELALRQAGAAAADANLKKANAEMKAEAQATAK